MVNNTVNKNERRSTDFIMEYDNTKYLAQKKLFLIKIIGDENIW